MNRFEQLIEYVINDNEQQARELFHDIVVEKSREIYENLMQEEAEEELDEAAEEELDEAAEEELDEAEASDEDEIEEGMMGGDAADSLIDDVEMEEESDINMEGEDEAEDDMGDDDMGGDDFAGAEGGADEAATKDDIMNLEDKLDELMAEFESLMGGDDMGNGDMMGPDEGGDAIEMDDTEEMTDEVGMMEAVSLKAAPKPVTSEEGGTNTKSTVRANSGATGMAGKPVHAGGEMGGKHDSSAYSNSTKDLIGDFQNKAGASMKDQKPATKPHLAQATGVNTKSPLPR